VAILVKRFPRLSETFILREVLELRRQGVHVDLYAIMDPREPHSQPEALAHVPEVTYLRTGRLLSELPLALRSARRHRWGTLKATAFAVSRHSRPALRNLIHALVLVAHLDRRGPVHLHAHFLHSPAAIAFIAHKISGQRYSATGHAKDIYTTLPENLQMRCRDAEFVTTCTAANRQHLISVTGLDPAKIHLCHHGVDVDMFSTMPRKAVPGRILSVGRLVPKKGFDILVRACAILARDGRDFELRIVGGGPGKEELTSLARQEGIEERVTFVGACSQQEVAEELSQAEIFALAPLVLPDGDRDGIPNVILEAMAAGVPVVATDVSGLPEVVIDGRTGRLVPQKDPKRFAAALDVLMSNSDKRRRMSTAGRALVLDKWQWEHAVLPLARLLTEATALPEQSTGDHLTAAVGG
jgi:glycosyltransferase involved in cell wall biosynthesis